VVMVVGPHVFLLAGACVGTNMTPSASEGGHSKENIGIYTWKKMASIRW
jgi:hypothetical protein